jgi:hypothetical protein
MNQSSLRRCVMETPPKIEGAAPARSSEWREKNGYVCESGESDDDSNPRPPA